MKYAISKSITIPNGPYYEWYDISDPPWGTAATKHVVQVPQGCDISKLDNMLFTVEPSSVGYLNPAKPGGVLPIVVRQYFKTILNTGDKAEINFTVQLWPDLDNKEIVARYGTELYTKVWTYIVSLKNFLILYLCLSALLKILPVGTSALIAEL